MPASTFLRKDVRYLSVDTESHPTRLKSSAKTSQQEQSDKTPLFWLFSSKTDKAKETCYKRDTSDIMLRSTICDLHPAPLDAVSLLSPENIQFITRAVSYKPVSVLVTNPTPLGT